MACESKTKCTCTYVSCSRHGKCCACVDYHRRNQEIPGCFFSEKGEKSYDRSLRNFLEDKRK